jgi:hypothetical protein
VKAGLEAWFDGKDIEFDFSKVRPARDSAEDHGWARLRSGAAAEDARTVKAIVLDAQGRQLIDIECLDIANHIGDAVQVGGVRRASEISFSDLDSEAMRHAKDFPIPSHRFMSNNSVAYNGRPDMITFMREWTALAASPAPVSAGSSTSRRR